MRSRCDPRNHAKNDWHPQPPPNGTYFSENQTLKVLKIHRVGTARHPHVSAIPTHWCDTPKIVQVRISTLVLQSLSKKDYSLFDNSIYCIKLAVSDRYPLPLERWNFSTRKSAGSKIKGVQPKIPDPNADFVSLTSASCQLESHFPDKHQSFLPLPAMPNSERVCILSSLG